MRLKPSALVVDDDPLFCKALESVLPRLGLDVKTTVDPERFLELSARHQPDLHLIDLHLTTMKGFSLIHRIREANPSAVIIVISGDDAATSLAHALENGANDFILKPLDRVLLASKLSRYVSTDRLKEHRSESVDSPEGRAAARLSVGVEISGVDELGVALVSRHLIPKGTVLKLRTDLWKLAGAAVEEVLVTVASTSYDGSSESFLAYAEFDESDPGFLEALRGWLRRAIQTE